MEQCGAVYGAVSVSMGQSDIVWSSEQLCVWGTVGQCGMQLNHKVIVMIMFIIKNMTRRFHITYNISTKGSTIVYFVAFNRYIP